MAITKTGTTITVTGTHNDIWEELKTSGVEGVTLGAERVLILSAFLNIDGTIENKESWTIIFKKNFHFLCGENCDWTDGQLIDGKVYGYTKIIFEQTNLSWTSQSQLNNSGVVKWYGTDLFCHQVDKAGWTYPILLSNNANNIFKDVKVRGSSALRFPWSRISLNASSDSNITIENLHISMESSTVGMPTMSGFLNDKTNFSDIEHNLRFNKVRGGTVFESFAPSLKSGQSIYIHGGSPIFDNPLFDFSALRAFGGTFTFLIRNDVEIKVKDLTDSENIKINLKANTKEYDIVTNSSGVASQKVETRLVGGTGVTTTDNSTYTFKIRRKDIVFFQETNTINLGKVNKEYSLSLDLHYDSSVDGATVTGVSVNSSTKTITVSENKTLQEIYNYIKHWLTDNMEVDNFMSVANQSLNISDYNMVINSGVSVSTTSKISTLTTTGTITNNGTMPTYSDSTRNSAVTIVGVDLAPTDNHLYVNTGSAWVEMSNNVYSYLANSSSSVKFRYSKGDGEIGDPIIYEDDYVLSSGLGNQFTSFTNETGQLIQVLQNNLYSKFTEISNQVSNINTGSTTTSGGGLTTEQDSKLTGIKDVVDGLHNPSADNIVSGVWSATVRDLTSTTGLTTNQEGKLNDIKTKVDSLDNPPSVNDITQGVWASSVRDLTVSSGLTTEQENKLNSMKTILDKFIFDSDSKVATQSITQIEFNDLMTNTTTAIQDLYKANSFSLDATELNKIVDAILSAPYGSKTNGAPLDAGSLGEHWYQFYPPEIVRQLLEAVLNGTTTPTRYQPTTGSYGAGTLGNALRDILEVKNNTNIINKNSQR